VDGFARGFVRTVAEALGLDAEEAVMRLLGEPPSFDEDQRVTWYHLRSFAAAALLLAGALVLLVWVGAWLVGGSGSSGGGAAGEIVHRRDAVRLLAEQQRAAGARSEPLESGREGHPD
jgi:hypothetical protein